ncbi:hypothetical protein D3C73_1317010 [compost metagenome]
MFGIGNEQVGAHQSLFRVVPAHQYFGASPAIIAFAHHRLEVRQELVSFQRTAQFGAW